MRLETDFNEAPKAGCLAHCLALCDGFRNADEACRILGEATPRFVERAVAARQLLFRGGERIEGVPIICHGWATALANLPNNRRQIFALLLPGDLVSGALIFEDRLDFSVETVTDVIYHSYDRIELRNALLADAMLLETMCKVRTRETSQIIRLAVSLGQCTAEERIARLLTSLAERLAQRHMKDNDTFPFPLRQRHIAEITGLTPVHVNRVINQLRRKGLIDIRHRSLTIRDPAALLRIGGM